MIGPLAPVPVAAAAEHHDEPPAGERAQRRERALERVGRVGVVAEHGARHVGDPLHPAGTWGDGGQPLDHLAERPSEAEGARRGRQRVAHVEVAQQRQRHLGACRSGPRAGTGCPPRRAPRRWRGGRRAGCRPKVTRGDRDGQRAPRLVVQVHHLDAARAAAASLSLSLAARYASMVPW